MGANSLIISSDSHVVEPPRLWSDRMDAVHGDRIPRLEVGDPHDQWYCDGEVVGTLGGASSAGMRFSRPQDIILDGSFAKVPPGGYDPMPTCRTWMWTASTPASSIHQSPGICTPCRMRTS